MQPNDVHPEDLKGVLAEDHLGDTLALALRGCLGVRLETALRYADLVPFFRRLLSRLEAKY